MENYHILLASEQSVTETTTGRYSGVPSCSPDFLRPSGAKSAGCPVRGHSPLQGQGMHEGCPKMCVAIFG